MTPDDPRHGKYAGRLAHYREGEPLCGPCEIAARRANKQTQHRLAHGIRLRVPLGEAAWRIVRQTQSAQLARATGLSVSAAVKLRRKTQTSQVLRSTRDNILRCASKCTTTVGIQRRLQALSYLGWSMTEVAKHSGVPEATLNRIRHGGSEASYLQESTYTGVVTAYARLWDTQPPPSRAATYVRRNAILNGYASPLAWDDDTIDDPDAKPIGLPSTASDAAGFDDSRVQRRIDGDRKVRLHKGETAEVVRRLLADGWGMNQIRRHTGIKPERYITREDVTREDVEVAA
jgi:hypothetical protein